MAPREAASLVWAVENMKLFSHEPSPDVQPWVKTQDFLHDQMMIHAVGGPAAKLKTLLLEQHPGVYEAVDEEFGGILEQATFAKFQALSMLEQ